MMERKLRLVVSNEVNEDEKETFWSIFEGLVEFIRCLLVSRNEKIYLVKDCLINLYRDYEISTGIIDEPYFIRAEKKMRRIIRENKVNYYYNLLKKYNNN